MMEYLIGVLLIKQNEEEIDLVNFLNQKLKAEY